MEILTQYPNWFIILCVLAGVLFAVALYLKDRLTSDLHPAVKLLLSVFRGVSIAVLAFFLLEPLVKNSFVETEKPVVVIAQDNSESILLKGDSTYLKNDYLQSIKNLTSTLEEKYDVSTLTFGSQINDGLNVDYTEKQTDYSALLDEIYARYSNRNLGAIILASDGIYTKGKNPLYSTSKLKTPIYTVALGDTTRFKDLYIKEVAHNKLAYLGNKFPVEIAVASDAFKGKTARVSISKNGSSVFSKTIQITSDAYLEVIPAILEARSPGIQKYTITISPLDGEVSTANNRKDIFIDVLDSRQKVALIAAHPHPDVNAIKSAIESNENYELDVFQAADFKNDIADYNMVIFHQLPSASSYDYIVNGALQKNVPSLFIWGSETNFNSFNELKLGVQLKSVSDGTNAVNSELNRGFKSFLPNEDFNAILRKLPPVNIPFGKMDASPGVNILLNQKIGPISTSDPLLMFNERNDVKVGVFTGEGLWRWRLFTHLEKGSHEAFDNWLLKSVQFLASKEDKSLFRVSTKSSFDETERIIFNSEVYNESFEPLAEQEINLTLKNDKGDDFPFTFSQNGSTYRLDAGILPAGNYTYASSVNASGKKLNRRGEFSIAPVIVEQLKTQADHNLLFNLAERNQGRMVFPNELDQLSSILLNHSEIVPVSYEKKTLSNLINYRWLLALILGLLCIEWLVRKRSGVY